jgi:hypothetical protein
MTMTEVHDEEGFLDKSTVSENDAHIFGFKATPETAETDDDLLLNIEHADCDEDPTNLNPKFSLEVHHGRADSVTSLNSI